MKGKLIIPILAIEFALFIILLLLVSIKAAIVLFCGGIIVTIVFFKPFWGLLIYLFMLYLRPQEFVSALKNQPLMLAMAFVVLGTLIIHNVIQRKPFVIFNMRQAIFMIVFLLLIPLSQLQRFYLTGAKLGFQEFLPTFLMFFMIINLITDMNQLKKTFYLLLFMTLFISLNGILQYHRGLDIAGRTTTVDGRIRWVGIFDDPNDLGLTILVFMPFALLKLLERYKPLLLRILWILILGALLYALYLTNSRGTFIGLLVVLFYFLIKRLGVIRGGLIGIALTAGLYLIGPSRLEDINVREASASGRIDAWITGLRLTIRRPILGVGYGRFTEFHHLTAHNSVVLCMTELGLVGLFVWLSMIVTSFREMIVAEKYTQGTELSGYAETLQMTIVGFMAAAFFLSRTYNEIIYIIIALCTLFSYFTRRDHGYKIPFFSLKTLTRVLVTMVILVMLVRLFVSF
ncbi:MAG: O-antigen ligase family protein [bacterium]|nr:MAG: O-antigen ligase family protein [bacterium]